MNYAQLEYYVSQPRLNRFLRACNNSKGKTQKLYKINLRVAQAFYPLMSLFETLFRNAMYNKLSQHFNDRDWIINQKDEFMSDPTLGTVYFLKNCVVKAESNIRRDRSIITSSKVIAEQTLGFWTAFFDNHHFILTHGAALRAFPNKPVHINRSQMALKLKGIR